MLTDIRPFRPVDENTATTQNIVVTSVAASVNLTGLSRSVRIVNIGNQTVFVRFVTASGGSAVTSSSMPVLAGTVETFFASNEVTAVSAVASASGSTIYITQGESA